MITDRPQGGEQAPAWSTTLWENRRHNMDGQLALFANAFEQARSVDEGRTVYGPLHGDLNDLFAKCTVLLDAIDPELPRDILSAWAYKSTKTQTLSVELGKHRPDKQAAVLKLAAAKRAAIDHITDRRMAELYPQSIDTGLLDAPAYAQQLEIIDCTNTTFFMVARELLGQHLYQDVFKDGVRKMFGRTVIDDDDYLKMLRSPIIGAVTDLDVQTVSLIGADLSMIAKLTAEIKKRQLGERVYCIVSLQTNPKKPEDGYTLDSWKSVWHSNILLSASDDYVEVHDPAKLQGGPNKQIPKDEFIKRWGQAYFRAHLVIA